MDDAWDMHMHINPIDREDKETIRRHKMLIENKTDDFI